MFNFNKNGLHVVKHRVWWMCLSALLIVPGIIAMIYSMMTYPTHSPLKVGIDYTGGSILQYETSAQITNADVNTTRETLANEGITNTYIQVLKDTSSTSDSKSMISIRTKFIDEGSDESAKISQIVQDKYKDAQLVQFTSVGPTLSSELFRRSFIALFVAILGIIAYISFRFEFKYAVSAIAGLIHDVLFVMGVFSILGLFFNCL